MAAATFLPKSEPGIRVCLLGIPSVEVHGKAIVGFRSSRIPALLGLLASKPGAQRRDFVATTLWPDTAPDEGRHNLRQLLLYIKQQFTTDLIRSDRYTIELARDVQTDLEVVLRAGATLKSVTEAEQSAKAAIDAYRGEFLEGLDDDWILGVRTQLSKAYVEAILLYADCCLATNPKRSLELAEMAIAAEPFLDGARVRKISALVAMSEIASAHREYGAYKQFLDSELGIEPSSIVVDALAPAKKTPVRLIREDESNLLDGTEAIVGLLNSNRPVRGLELAIAYAPHWMSQNLAKEGISLLNRALDVNQGSPHSDSFLRGRVAKAELLVAAGHDFDAKEILSKALPFLTNPRTRIRALNLYARIIAFSYRPQEGKEFIAQAVSLARELDVIEELVDALRYAAEIAIQLEDLKGADAYAKECLKLCKEIGDWNALASIRGQMAFIQERSGNPDETRKTLNLGLRELEGKVAYRATFTRGRFARLLEEIGDVQQAEAGYRQCIIESREFDDPRGLGICLTYLGDILATQKHYEEALSCHLEALAIRRRTAEILGEATSLRGIGRIYLATNRLTEAQEVLRDSSRLFLVAAVVPGHASALFELARVAKAKGEFDLALRIATQTRHLMMGMSQLSLRSIGPGSVVLLQQADELVKNCPSD